MPLSLAKLLLKFPFLKRVGTFLSSAKFLVFLGAVIVALFITTQVMSGIGKYVDHQVKTEVQLSEKKMEVTGLKEQVRTLENNQKIVEVVVHETKVKQEEQAVKAEKIEEKIDEQVKEGVDGYSGVITSSVIDSL